MARGTVIDLRNELGDGRVQCGEREELSVAQLGDDEASRDLNRNLSGALLDRLTHHVHILELNGESYRLAQSKRRSRRQPETPLQTTTT